MFDSNTKCHKSMIIMFTVWKKAELPNQVMWFKTCSRNNEIRSTILLFIGEYNVQSASSVTLHLTLKEAAIRKGWVTVKSCVFLHVVKFVVNQWKCEKNNLLGHVDTEKTSCLEVSALHDCVSRACCIWIFVHLYIVNLKLCPRASSMACYPNDLMVHCTMDNHMK